MKDKISLHDLVEQLVAATGLSKKQAEKLLHAIPEVIEAGLKRDGIVKVKGLGTFRLKRVKARMGRNLQTGERVSIPAHSKAVFTPEKQLKDHVNSDFRYLSYKELDDSGAVVSKPQEEKKPKPEPEEKVVPVVEKPQAEPEKEVVPVVEKPQPEPEEKVVPVVEKSQPEPEKEVVPVVEKPEAVPEKPVQPEIPEEPKKTRKSLYWIIPITILIILVLIIIFYFRACRDTGPAGTPQPDATEKLKEQEKPAEKAEVTDISAIPEEPPETQLAPETMKETIYTLKPGNYLYRLAGRFYGDSLFWVLIYKANTENIYDPDFILIGDKLIIPPLEGDRHNLSSHDSLELSESHRLLYEYYGETDDPVTGNFYHGMIRYRPK